MARSAGSYRSASAFPEAVERLRAERHRSSADDAGDPVDVPTACRRPARRQAGPFRAIQGRMAATPQVTLNLGLRFDQIAQYVSGQTSSARAPALCGNLSRKRHRLCARHFTPPPQLLVAAGARRFSTSTHRCAGTLRSSPVRPERSHYFDAGIEQRVLPGSRCRNICLLQAGRDKPADDGQFRAGAGHAGLQLQHRAQHRRRTEGEIRKRKLPRLGQPRLGETARKARDVEPAPFDADEYQWLAGHYAYTDHAQTWTGSAGASIVERNAFSADLVYGSGLRAGSANTLHMSPYAQGECRRIARICCSWPGPLTLRFDAVNLFDRITRSAMARHRRIRLQYGPRRAFYAGVSQKF